MDFDDLFALRVYYENNPENIIIKNIKTYLVDHGYTNIEANHTIKEFYKSFGVNINTEELEDIIPLNELTNNFLNSILTNFSTNNINELNIEPTINNTVNENEENVNENEENVKENEENVNENEENVKENEENVKENEESDNENEENDENEESDNENEESDNDFNSNIYYSFRNSDLLSSLAANLITHFLESHSNQNQEYEYDDVICTLDNEEITKLKTEILENDHENSCVICMDLMEKNQEILVLPCNHYFHNSCINNWLLNYNYKCPICKTTAGTPKYNI
jgi:hypothetical protein